MEQYVTWAELIHFGTFLVAYTTLLYAVFGHHNKKK